MAINDKQQCFIDNYMTNGHNASKAYAKAYPDCKTEESARKAASRLLTNVDIKAEITRQMAIASGEARYSLELCQLEYEQARQHAQSQRSASAEVSAITGKARLYGYDKDSSADRDSKTQPLTAAQRILLQEQAKALTGPKLKRDDSAATA